MAKSAPYLVGDKWTIDVDPDDELNYVWNVAQWMIDNATSVVSFELIPTACVVLDQGAPQGTSGSLLPAKIKVDETGANPACTARISTLDGQQFDKTMYFNRVQN